MNFSSQEIPASPVETVVYFHAFHVDLFVLNVEIFAVTIKSILFAHNSKSEFIKQESTTDGTDSSGSDITPQPKRQRKYKAGINYRWHRF